MTQLALNFARNAAGQTILAQRRISYPYAITAPLRGPEGEARLILQSISGGLYGGETLSQILNLSENAQARLTQPAATTVRRRVNAASPAAHQIISLQAAPRASLIYATRPLIFLPGAALVQEWDISLSPDARILFFDGFLGHNPNGNAQIWSFNSRIIVRGESGKPRAIEKMQINSGQIDRMAYRAFGKFWCLGDWPLPAPAALPEFPAVSSGISALPGQAGFTIALAAQTGGALCAAMDSCLSFLENPLMHSKITKSAAE